MGVLLRGLRLYFEEHLRTTASAKCSDSYRVGKILDLIDYHIINGHIFTNIFKSGCHNSCLR